MQQPTSIRFNDVIGSRVDAYMKERNIKNKNFAISRLVLQGLQAEELKQKLKAGKINEILKDFPVKLESTSPENWSEITTIDLMSGPEKLALAHILKKGEIV